MHAQSAQWLTESLHENPDLTGGRALDVGSYNINGSARDYLGSDWEVTGLDWRSGPGVDVVSIAHEYNPKVLYDLVVCLSMLEHDPYWKKTVKALQGFTAQKGLIVVTVPGEGWLEHEMDCTPLEGYYQTRKMGDLVNLFDLDVWKVCAMECNQNHTRREVYLWARRR